MAKSTDAAQAAILQAIVKETNAGLARGEHVRALAEAWAWLEYPDNSHGGSVKASE